MLVPRGAGYAGLWPCGSLPGTRAKYLGKYDHEGDDIFGEFSCAGGVA
jgi:hypothetical protein